METMIKLVELESGKEHLIPISNIARITTTNSKYELHTVVYLKCGYEFQIRECINTLIDLIDNIEIQQL